MKSFQSGKIINDTSALADVYSPWINAKGYKQALVFASAGGSYAYVYGTSKKDGAGNPTGGVEIASQYLDGTAYTQNISVNTLCYDYVRVLITNGFGAPKLSYIYLQDEN